MGCKGLSLFLTPKMSKSRYQKSDRLFHYQPEFQGIESILYFFCKDLIDEQWLNAYVLTDFNAD